jgi:hypothetical protein
VSLVGSAVLDELNNEVVDLLSHGLDVGVLDDVSPFSVDDGGDVVAVTLR